MHSGHGFAYDTMRRAEVYSRHPHLEAAGQDSLALQHSLASSAGLDHQVLMYLYFFLNFLPTNCFQFSHSSEFYAAATQFRL